MSSPARRVELPGMSTVDWETLQVGWVIPTSSRCEHGWACALTEYGARLQVEARRHHRMISQLQVKVIPEGLLLYATSCGSPN